MLGPGQWQDLRNPRQRKVSWLPPLQNGCRNLWHQKRKSERLSNDLWMKANALG